jgi:hypothetical protein
MLGDGPFNHPNRNENLKRQEISWYDEEDKNAFDALLEYELTMREVDDPNPHIPTKGAYKVMKNIAQKYNTSIGEMKKHWREVDQYINKLTK